MSLSLFLLNFYTEVKGVDAGGCVSLFRLIWSFVCAASPRSESNSSFLTSLDLSGCFLDAHGVDAVTAALCSAAVADAVLARSPLRSSPAFKDVYEHWSSGDSVLT